MPRAGQNQLMNFIRLCEEHAIPCDSFQLSSGYTSINGKRYALLAMAHQAHSPGDAAADDARFAGASFHSSAAVSLPLLWQAHADDEPMLR
ncbi:glycosyl hydrolase, family 31 family protein [Enterobacter hormaechei subsp. xiangfangensis]|nr:glycosyl hydrolase, family 31 family protein [Enterobacter hormaechei subsp. xiangfangensis]